MFAKFLTSDHTAVNLHLVFQICKIFCCKHVKKIIHQLSYTSYVLYTCATLQPVVKTMTFWASVIYSYQQKPRVFCTLQAYLIQLRVWEALEDSSGSRVKYSQRNIQPRHGSFGNPWKNLQCYCCAEPKLITTNFNKNYTYRPNLLHSFMDNPRVKVEVRTSRINFSKDNTVTKAYNMRNFVLFTLYSTLLYLSKIVSGIP